MTDLSRLLLLGLFAFVLTACGNSKEASEVLTSEEPTEVSNTSIENIQASPEQLEEEAEPSLDLPEVSGAFGHDLLGVRLGMVPAEIRSALGTAFDTEIEYTNTSNEIYHDRYKPELGTRPIGEIATISAASETIRIIYNYPPDDLAAMSILRTKIFPHGEEPLKDTIFSSLIEKYGNAYIETTNPYAMGNRNSGQPYSWVWRLDPEKPNCAMSNGKPNFKGANEGGLGGDVSPDNPSACSDLLGVSMGIFAGDIVGNISFKMVDYDLALTSYNNYVAWGKQREAEQVAERRKDAGQVEAPKL